MANHVVIEKPVVSETPGNPDACPPVQLYIKLIEADSLQGVNSRNPDLFVEFWIETLSSVELSGTREKSLAYKSSLHPIWNEEWVLPRLPTDASTYRLHFVLYEYYSLWPNTALSQAVFDLHSFSDGELKNISLDLVKYVPLESGRQQPEFKSLPHETSFGKLRLLVHKTPLFETSQEKLERQLEISKKWARLSSLRIVLEKLTYFPGEIIRGMVISNTGNAESMRALRLHVVGETKVLASPVELSDLFEVVKARYQSIDSTATLMGNGVKYGDGEIMEVKGKSFCFPFSFPLPVALPPTYHGRSGSTKYRISAYADQRIKRNKKTTVAFQVLAQYSSYIPNSLAISVSSGDDTKSLPFSNKMTLPFAISTPTFADAGSIVPVALMIENPVNSDKNIIFIRVSLTQHSIYRGLRRRGYSSLAAISSSTMTENSILRDPTSPDGPVTSVLPIEPGRICEIIIPLPVPELTPPTSPEQLCHILSNQYYIEAHIATDGGIFTSSSHQRLIPIVISRRHATAPRPIAAPKHIEEQLPVRVAGDGSLSIDGTFHKETLSTVVSPISDFVSVEPSSSRCSKPNTNDQTPEEPPEGVEDSPLPMHLEGGYVPTESSLPVQNARIIGAEACAAMVPPVSKTGAPNIPKYLAGTSQRLSSSDMPATSLNGILDSPATYIVSPGLVMLRKPFHGRFRGTLPDHPVPLPHHIVIDNKDQEATHAEDDVAVNDRVQSKCSNASQSPSCGVSHLSSQKTTVSEQIILVESQETATNAEGTVEEEVNISSHNESPAQPLIEMASSNMPPSYEEAVVLATKGEIEGETRIGEALSDPLLQAPEEDKINTAAKLSEMGTFISVWAPSQAIPTFDDFLPPRPLDLWTMDIPVTAAKLPEYTALTLKSGVNDPSSSKT